MGNQPTFSDMEYANRKRITKREAFLNLRVPSSQIENSNKSGLAVNFV